MDCTSAISLPAQGTDLSGGLAASQPLFGALACLDWIAPRWIPFELVLYAKAEALAYLRRFRRSLGLPKTIGGERMYCAGWLFRAQGFYWVDFGGAGGWDC